MPICSRLSGRRLLLLGLAAALALRLLVVATLAARLLQLAAGAGATFAPQRDLGVLLFHVAAAEALEHLEAFELWSQRRRPMRRPTRVGRAQARDRRGAGGGVAGGRRALAKLMLDLRRMALEEALESEGG